MNTKYGLICVSKVLKEEDPSNSFVGLTRKDYGKLSSEEGDKAALNRLQKDILHNLDLTVKIIDFCRDSNIDHYRLNTSIFGILADPSFDIGINDLLLMLLLLHWRLLNRLLIWLLMLILMLPGLLLLLYVLILR